MKKDYKLSEIKQICANQLDEGCKTCPVKELCDSYFYDTITLPWQWDLIEPDDELNKKLELLNLLKSKADLIVEDNIISLRINYINLFKNEFDAIMRWLRDERL